MKKPVKQRVKRALIIGVAVVALPLLGAAECTSTDQQDPVEKEFKLKNGDTVKCLVIYDEYGETIEETVTCSPIEAAGQPTA